MTAPATAPDRAQYVAQQRIVRTAVDQAQAAWQQLDGTADPVAVWTGEGRPQVVATIEQAQAASLAPLYVAAVLATAGAVSAPVAALIAAAFAGVATNGLPLAVLWTTRSAATVRRSPPVSRRPRRTRSGWPSC